MSSLEVLFAPAEFMALRGRDLSETACVVFDILRATSTMLTALDAGAARIIPVSEIEEALALRRLYPDCLLAGERDGVRIRSFQTGGTDFDLGNSPREFTGDAVRGKTIVITTTNGTRALRACASASAILIGAFLNLGALADWLRKRRTPNLLLVCAGTIDQASYEDTLAAGALADSLWPLYETGQIADSAAMSRDLFRHAAQNLPQTVRSARNGRRLLANPALSADVSLCLRRDALQLVAQMTPDGVISAEAAA
jgi:2-phosphosulfolactate phosphatase